MCGVRPEAVKTLNVSVSDDQDYPEDIKTKEYWGWYSFKKEALTMIQPTFITFGIQFAYGVNTAEFNKKDGIAVRLNITEIER